MTSRGQVMDHSEDWVDGSWTVDCVCGVNFDDGEEMVDCDECGVWVHTRCSRYVKGEKSFACDKCKLKNNRNISEENEVAQLLVDLPKNTMKRDNSLRLNDASRRPLWLWAEKPMDDRVHVHGIPGGDPQLFSGMSGNFTPQLWKAAGYVPKKFNFRYKEFACWEQDEEKNSKDSLGNQSPFDTGADALYSMSKETLSRTRLSLPLGNRVNGKGENIAHKVDAKETKRVSCVCLDAENSLDDSENEKGTHQSSVSTPSQQRKDLLTSQDRTGKRKARPVDKEFDGQKRIRHSSGSVVFSPASDQRLNESSGDKKAKLFQTDAKCAMKDSVLDAAPHDPVLERNLLQENSIVEANKYSNSNPVWEARSADTANCNGTIEAAQNVAKVDHQGTAGIEENVMIYSSVINNAVPFSFKEEVAGAVSGLVTCLREKPADVIISKVDIAPTPGCMITTIPQVQDSRISQDLITGMCQQSQPPKLEVDSLSSNVTTRVDGMKYMNNHSLAGLDIVKTVSSPQSSGKEQTVQATSNAANNSYANAADVINDISVVPNLEIPEGGKKPKVMSENNHGSVQAENFSESGEATCFTMLPSQRKMAVSVVRSTSTNSVSKYVVSDDCKAEQSKDSSIYNRNQMATTGTSCSLKEQGVSSADKDGERRRKNPKESPRGSGSPVWKNSHFSKYSRSHRSKETFSRTKDHESRSFAKAKQDNIVTSDSGESAGSLQAQGASLGPKKVTSSGSSGSLQNRKKRSQVTNSVSSKVSNMTSSQRHLLNASHAALSDEELALLLHQELNSSPRVPRIPRMRQAGSIPQSASPTAANTLVKLTSGSGGNDYPSVSRRKSKDNSGNKTHMPAELDDKPRKAEKGSSTCKQCIHESTSKVDRSKRELDERSFRTYGSAKRNRPINVTKSHSLSHNSLKNIFDEEIGIEGSPYRTLPELISEIMSKGKRMTYEKLCNAVLPHWNNLRKHNGERYAYTSHSHAVLDCLRNRSEWAQLVDRGPKTNPGRKGRKLDTEQASSDSEDGELVKNKVPKSLDCRNLVCTFFPRTQ